MSDGTDLQQRILAWMEQTGRGYKAASVEFDVPRATVQKWAQAERSGRPRKPNARTRARAQAPDDPPPDDPAELPAYDPAAGSRREYLERSIRRAAQMVETLKGKHGGVAQRWATLEAHLREQLEELLRDEREEQARQAREAAPDPLALCRRVTALAAVLARVVPTETRNLIAALQAALPREE